MTIPPGSIVPADTLVTPIVQQLAIVAQQIQGITSDNCFIEPPDQAVPDNSVLFPLREWQILDDTNGKFYVKMTFEVLHLFVRQDLSLQLPNLYALVPAWHTVLTAASNNSLGGLAITIGLASVGGQAGKPGTVRSIRWGGAEYLGISNTLFVLTEFNINQS